MNQLRVRETRQYGQTARYANVDLGGDKGRGDATQSYFRELGDGRIDCITFLMDTFHNRCVLLARNVEVAEVMPDSGKFILVPPSWLDSVFGAAVTLEEFFQGQRMGPLTVAPAMGENVVKAHIGSLGDFMCLTKEAQLAAVANPGCPYDILAAVAEASEVSVMVRKAASRQLASTKSMG